MPKGFKMLEMVPFGRIESEIGAACGDQLDGWSPGRLARFWYHAVVETILSKGKVNRFMAEFGVSMSLGPRVMALIREEHPSDENAR
jgi:hypothetical protein